MFTLYQVPKATHKSFHLKISNLTEPLWLSDILPMLENMGLRVKAEATAKTHIGKQDFWSHDFSLALKFQGVITFSHIKKPFQDCLKRVWEEKAENNLFNSLIIGCGLSWREVMLLQAYYKYLRQVDATYTLEYVANCFLHYPKLTGLLLEFFNHQFNPDLTVLKTPKINKLLERIDQQMDTVTNGDTDKILRCFLELILGTVRTNYFQDKDYISLKIDCRLIPFLPEPRPLYEIFVYAAHMEGIHLRSSKVARGGIRWSDRKEDFRTEILGLMKAQKVKNSIIVPDGAKGGFIIKKNLHNFSFQESQAEAIRCYETLIRGLLDLTDSWDNGKVVHPPRVRRLDADDPYLVVAADKGTASFSDIANSIAGEYNFWLGDAFASGGSAGYDHKAMAITARGVWKSVERHFAEMDHDINKDPFSVVGVGDMAGDLFGNGMLLSPNISLRAAFNHQHIFLDPNPNLKKSYAERQRLFNKSRSTWADYDPEVLSKGGGIYSRQEKMIIISPEAKKVLGLSKTRLSPQDLIQDILKAPVDLLWMGGIGTFVKAEIETHTQVADRSNDSIRINGSVLRCKIVAEGANLGFTQLARIEYAQRGGRLNTDAIDNSGGVDCSDHEVNLKILFKDIMKDNLLTLKSRNKLLEAMTDDVATLVLRDNFLQTQMISLEQQEGVGTFKPYRTFLNILEDNGALNREVESLPSDEMLEDRRIAKKPFTRPEISVVIAYGKLFAYDKIIATNLPDSPESMHFLETYFPATLHQKYMPYIQKHALRREIITTQMANEIVNHLGPCFLSEMMVQTNKSALAVLEAYLKVRKELNLTHKWQAIESTKTSMDQKYSLFRKTIQTVQKTCLKTLQY